MEDIGPIGLFIVLVIFYVSYNGFRNRAFFDKYSFEVERVLFFKEYYRIITSGFLHVNWRHLLFNIFSLAAFSGGIVFQLGTIKYLLIYFVSLICGNLFALYIHRNHSDYSAVGASGAISGLIFASVALFPGIEIGFFGLPFYIPAWLYAILFVFISIYGIRSQTDNIGHEAHLGGAVAGMLAAIGFQPEALRINYLPIVLLLVPTSFFIYMIISRPYILYIDNAFFKKHNMHYTIEDKYHSEKQDKQSELDNLLEKISKKGLNNLTKKERQRLDDLSK